MTHQAKVTCPRWQLSEYRLWWLWWHKAHLFTKQPSRGPWSSTTTKDNWTTVFWSNQQGKGPQRDQKVKVDWVPTSISHKRWDADTDVHCTKTVIRLWSKEAHLTSKQPQGLTTTKDVTKSLFPWHTSHHIKVTNNSKIFFVLWDFSRHVLLGHLDKICSRLNPWSLHHIDSMEF